MYQDVVELRSFYNSPLGRVTARLIRNQISTLWSDMGGIDVMGLGYAIPYLDIFRGQSNNIISIMPATQGVVHWPRHHGTGKEKPRKYNGNLNALAHEGNLPIKDAVIDRILMVHILEHAEQSHYLLREVWRTLAPRGRVIVVVPNRLGFWTRTERTPFGHGTPFSVRQVNRILSDNMLTPMRATTALHTPPFKSRALLSLLPTLEHTGQKWWHNLAGALIIEAEKQIYATGNCLKKQKQMSRPIVAGGQVDRTQTLVNE